MLRKKEKIDNIKETNVEKQKTLIDRIMHKKGLTLFEYNLETKKVSKAEYDKKFWDPINKKGISELIVKKGYVYREFLNLKNAEKGFKKLYS